MEGGKNARRRMSATSEDNDGASAELLEHDNDASDDGVHQQALGVRRKKRTDRMDQSRWLRPFGLLFCALVLGALSFSSLQTLFYPTGRLGNVTSGGLIQQQSKEEAMLGIPLHPEDHVSRRPKIITLHWNVTSGYRSPDGVRKEVYLVNGQFPGPTIECRSGDCLVVHVTNSISDAVADTGEGEGGEGERGISIHWHGLLMRDANDMNGAVGFTQCPIPSGRSFAYEFDVDNAQSGTFWWHAHSHVQRGDGLFGGLVVHQPAGLEAGFQVDTMNKEVLLLIGDWYHRSSDEVLSWYMSTRGFGNEPVPDSLLINGAGKFICSMAVPARPVECIDIKDEDALSILGHEERTFPLRLRIVNVGSLAGFTLRLSSGTLTPLSVDGDFPIESQASTSVGILYPGERVDLCLRSDEPPSANMPKLHIDLDPENFKFPNPALRPNQSFPLTAEIHEQTKVHAHEPSKHFDLAAATSINLRDSQDRLSDTAQQTILLYTKTQKLAKLSNHPTGFINRTSWATQSSPSLPLLSLKRHQWDSNQLVPWVEFSETSNSWVDIVVNNLDDGVHPFHLHGNDFYVLASHRSEHGWGSYSPYETSGSSSIKPKLNLVNPLRKDTVSVPRRGYVVLRFRPDNPGVWMFHCHVLFHQASGMAMGILGGRDEGHEVVDASAGSLCGYILLNEQVELYGT